MFDLWKKYYWQQFGALIIITVPIILWLNGNWTFAATALTLEMAALAFMVGWTGRRIYEQGKRPREGQEDQ